jgi:LEA14-like dessication related protein
MLVPGNSRALLLVCALLGFSGCTHLPQRDPVQVYVVGIEPLQGQGLELRMLVKLRVQNPNDTSIDYNGIHIGMNVQGKRFASGVSDAAGTIPRFGEAVIGVPISVAAFRLVGRAMDIFGTPGSGKLEYELQGKLAGPIFKSVRFRSSGEMALPEGVYASPGTD